MADRCSLARTTSVTGPLEVVPCRRGALSTLPAGEEIIPGKTQPWRGATLAALFLFESHPGRLRYWKKGDLEIGIRSPDDFFIFNSSNHSFSLEIIYKFFLLANTTNVY